MLPYFSVTTQFIKLLSKRGFSSLYSHRTRCQNPLIKYLLSDCVDYSDNPNVYEFIAEDMEDPGFDDTYFQSTNSDNQHLFAQSMEELVLEFQYEL